jgi:hypothetical protein
MPLRSCRQQQKIGQTKFFGHWKWKSYLLLFFIY